MKLNKIVKRYGNTAALVLNKEDLKILRLTYGDVLELEIKKIRRVGKRQ